MRLSFPTPTVGTEWTCAIQAFSGSIGTHKRKALLLLLLYLCSTRVSLLIRRCKIKSTQKALATKKAGGEEGTTLQIHTPKYYYGLGPSRARAVFLRLVY